MESDIEEVMVNDGLVPEKHTDEEMAAAIATYVKWFGNSAQYRNDSTVADWNIEKTAVPDRSEGDENVVC